MNDLYFKYLSKTIEHQLNIDLTSYQLLKIIASCSRYEALTVNELINIQELGSPATLFKKLTQLSKEGLVYDQHIGDDKRSKYLYPTFKARTHFDRLSKAMITVTLDSLKEKNL
jgi:DNA-binding MarR family transcriptional regulator